MPDSAAAGRNARARFHDRSRETHRVHPGHAGAASSFATRARGSNTRRGCSGLARRAADAGGPFYLVAWDRVEVGAPAQVTALATDLALALGLAQAWTVESAAGLPAEEVA